MSIYFSTNTTLRIHYTRKKQNFENRPFSKVAAETSNKSKLKMQTNTRKNNFILAKLQSFSFSGIISAETNVS